MILIVPFINPPMYSTLFILRFSFSDKPLASFLLNGVGAVWVGKGTEAFAVAYVYFFAHHAHAGGYQPVGTKPFERLLPGVETSNTGEAIVVGIGYVQRFFIGRERHAVGGGTSGRIRIQRSRERFQHFSLL